MGANDKAEATYHGRTPDTQIVEHAYVAYRSSKVDLITGHHEFTRWLETVRAEAKAEALEEMANDLESRLAGYTRENGQTLAGREIIRELRDRTEQIRGS